MYKVFNLKLENGKKGIENINEDIFAQFNSKSFIEENFSGIMDAIRELFPVFPNNDYNGGYNNFENWFYQNSDTLIFCIWTTGCNRTGSKVLAHSKNCVYGITVFYYAP